MAPPFTGHPGQVLSSLRRSVAASVAADDVTEFYIGRSVHMEGRGSFHGSDETRCLYETTSIDHAIHVEDALIDHFHGHAKCSNEQTHGGGGVGGGDQHVYLALWFR